MTSRWARAGMERIQLLGPMRGFALELPAIPRHKTTMSDNVRASLLMIATMAGFAVEDLLLKILSSTVPIGQMMIMLGIGGGLFFGLVSVFMRWSLWSNGLLSRPFAVRSAGELISSAFGLIALTMIPLSLASSILQAAPLLVTIGAAIFLGEKVGWRRWTAIAVGIVGVLLILRPGTNTYNPAVWLAVIAVVAIAARDLATRATPPELTTIQLTFWGYSLSIIAGIFTFAIMGQQTVWPTYTEWLMLGAAQVLGIVFYFTLTLALRIGESSVVVPFRYSRLVFALALGVLILDERVDGWMMLGLALVTVSGVYTLLREARVNRLSRRASLAATGGV